MSLASRLGIGASFPADSFAVVVMDSHLATYMEYARLAMDQRLRVPGFALFK
jgi:hypothetical protein